jgi:hypothetical protein
MEKSSFYVIILILILGFILNPDSDDFEEYLAEKSLEGVDGKDNMLTQEIMGSMITAIFPFERQDYKVCSIYEIKGLNLIENKKIKFIGVFGFFIQIEGDDVFD